MEMKVKIQGTEEEDPAARRRWCDVAVKGELLDPKVSADIGSHGKLKWAPEIDT